MPDDSRPELRSVATVTPPEQLTTPDQSMETSALPVGGTEPWTARLPRAVRVLSLQHRGMPTR